MLFRFHVIITILAIFTQARPVILNFTDPVVEFSPDWTLSHTKPLSSSSSLPPADQFVYSKQTSASLDVNLPNDTIAVDCVGPKRKGDVCLDCERDGATFRVNNNSSTDNDAPSVVLFSRQNVEPPGTHSLAVRTLPDTRLQRRSKLTFDSVIARVNNDGVGIRDNSAGGLTPTATAVLSLPPGGITLTVTQTSTPTPPTLPPALGSPSVTLSQFVGSDPTTTPIRSGSTSQISSAPATDAVSNSPTADSSTQLTTTFSSSLTPLTPATVTSPSPTAVTSAAIPTVLIPNSNPNENGSNTINSDPNTDNSHARSQRISNSLIAVISVLSILAGLSLLIGVFLYARMRKRRRSVHRLPDLERDNPRTPLRQVERSQAEVSLPPPRPRNPFENVSPATVSLDDLNLDYPTDARLTMNRTMIPPSTTNYNSSRPIRTIGSRK